MKTLFVFGTRPEAIKLSCVIRELSSRPGQRCRVCVTGQHRGELDRVLAFFGIKPDHDLNLIKEGQSLHHVAARTLEGLGPILARERPDRVVVQGDTVSAAAAALSAFYAGVPVAHVEAGLRTDDLRRPFPEEADRRLIDVLCDVHFAPTPRAKANLLREGFPASRIFVTGNTGIDALRLAPRRRAEATGGRALVLATMHRRESFGRPLEEALSGLRELARRRPDARVVFVLHPNPKVRRAARKILARSQVELLPPQDYRTMIGLLRSSRAVLTDSGGLQEEAATLGVPVLVLREKTDRPEAVAAGLARVVGTKPGRIVREAEQLLDGARRSQARRNLYGDGRASKRIAGILARLGRQ